MNGLPQIAVVILNWNGQSFLEKFLPSVYNSSWPNLEIIVGDNASTDGSVDFIKTHFPQIRMIINNRNYGFAGGYNEVLNQVRADYFILLNSDVEVHPGWIEPVIRLMESDLLIAAAQPKILSYYKKENFEYAGAAGGLLDTYGYPFCRGRIFDYVEKDTGQYNEAKEIFWASGAAFFIRSSCWKEMNGFDANFFAHMEEIDLCWRLKNRGYRIMYCPDSSVYHVGGGTLNADSPYKTYLNFRNNLIMLKKNLPPSKVYLIIFIRFWFDLLSLIRFILQGRPALALAISKAHRHFLWNWKKHIERAPQLPKEINPAGLYHGSIVWEYFAKKKKTIRELGID